MLCPSQMFFRVLTVFRLDQEIDQRMTCKVIDVELAARKENPVPLSWGVGAGGKETTDPSKVLNGGGLLPLGGVEVSGGYKGYGLSSMIEIFCGILAGAHWGPHVRKWMSTNAEADLGQCFVAIDPEAFAPGFAERLQDFMQTMRALPTSSPSFKVEVAGDMEKRHELLVEELGGIPYHKNQIAFINELAGKLGVEPVDLIQ
uniref:Malate dehydrogenase n=2 Tax=Caenorhabditis tropicalis TaxID=1561998 RepID=A0A1I7T165_9PELO